MKLIYSTTIGKIADALGKAQAEMGKAHKSSNNPAFNSKYANLAECLDVALPVLNKHGIAFTQLPGAMDGRVCLTTLLVHASGEYLGCEDSMAPQKPGPHAHGSCLTYLRRYGLAAITGLAQDDDDGNGAVEKAGPIDEKQLSILRDMIADSGADTVGFIAYMGAENMEGIAASDFNKAVAALRAKKKKVAG